VTPLQHNAILIPSEKERGRKDIGRGNQGKKTEQATKTWKDEKAQKSAESTTAPARTKVTHDPPPATREIPPDTRRLFGNPNETPLPAPSPGSDQDECTTLQLPASTIATKKDESNTPQKYELNAPQKDESNEPQQDEVLVPATQESTWKSTYGSPNYDLPLITSCG
jgi:hypothetical protein